MTVPAPFDPIVRDLRAELISHFEARGKPLDGPGGRRTLDTNSTLAPRRADLLIQTYLARSGYSTLEGRVVADLGCGFGSLALVLAAHGARVIAADPSRERVEVGARIAAAHGLDVRFLQGSFDEPGLGPESVEAVFINNAFCYMLAGRRQALRTVGECLVPGGLLILRDPNRAAVRDPFTGLPLLHRLPVAGAGWAARRVGRPRSRVLLRTPRAARRELRRAGFTEVRYDGSGGPRSVLDRISNYHHTSARRPPAK